MTPDTLAAFAAADALVPFVLGIAYLGAACWAINVIRGRR